MNIIKRPLGLYKANCYVLIKDGKSLIIDPGFHSKHIKRIATYLLKRVNL